MHRVRRAPPPPPPPPQMILGTQPRRRPLPSASEPRGLGIPRDPGEARTQLEPKVRASSHTHDQTSAKLLVIASVMSLVVVLLSLAVLSKTSRDLFGAEKPAPKQIEAAPVVPPAPVQTAVEEKQIEKKPIERQAIEDQEIAAESAPAHAPKKAIAKKKLKKRPPKKKIAKQRPKSDSEVFLTGSDL